VSQFDQLVRLQEWELDEKRRVLVEKQEAVLALIDKRQALEDELAREQAIASSSVEASVSYGVFANQVIERRAQIDAEILEKEEEVAEANDEMVLAFQELRKAEIVRDEYNERERLKALRLEQLEIDEIARNLHRRKSG